jgi:hypothetical protein
MSQLGHERTRAEVGVTSVLPSITDLRRTSQHVCFVPGGDLSGCSKCTNPHRPDRARLRPGTRPPRRNWPPLACGYGGLCRPKCYHFRHWKNSIRYRTAAVTFLVGQPIAHLITPGRIANTVFLASVVYAFSVIITGADNTFRAAERRLGQPKLSGIMLKERLWLVRPGP